MECLSFKTLLVPHQQPKFRGGEIGSKDGALDALFAAIGPPIMRSIIGYVDLRSEAHANLKIEGN